MALNYSISMLSNPMKPGEAKKAYAKAQISQELTLKELSRLVAGQTTVSHADVSAVLIATVDNMIDSLCAGEQVDFGELGKFRLQITNRGAETAEKFTAANITRVNIQFVPSEDLRNIFAGMGTPVPTRTVARAVLKAPKAEETMVDISGKDTSGGGSTGGGGNSGGSGEEEENPLE